MLKAVKFSDHRLNILDQTRLPSETVYIECRTAAEVAAAIRDMKVRGAPAIGVAAAYALVLAAKSLSHLPWPQFKASLAGERDQLAASRPTAVNLFWALERMMAILQEAKDPAQALRALEQEAVRIEAEDLQMNKRLAELGARIVPPEARVLTHCNAGALATAGYGTALGVIRRAHELGKIAMVYVDETRPLLQGSRLTAWEMVQDQIPATLIADNMAASLMAAGKIDLVLVGADRIAANGDAANKIGTYGLAVLACYHHIPFYIAAPWSTVDLSLADGTLIPIEERDPGELKKIGDLALAPAEIKAYNPAFDVTPHGLITGIITDRGILRPPFAAEIKEKGLN